MNASKETMNDPPTSNVNLQQTKREKNAIIKFAEMEKKLSSNEPKSYEIVHEFTSASIDLATILQRQNAGKALEILDRVS